MKKHLALYTLILGLFLSSCSLFTSKAGKPQHLLCEYRVNPMGIVPAKPRLGWMLNDTRRGARQTAYQIQVATTRERLEKNQPDMWDTGKEESGQSVQVEYDGSLTETGHRYYWRVRSWDQNGEVSPFSEIAWWETALLYPIDWQDAKWIGKHEKRSDSTSRIQGMWIWHPSEHGIGKPIYFRHLFSVAGKPVKAARMYITADNAFQLYVNGQEVGEGTVWQRLNEYPVEKLLQAGDNLIAVRATNTAGTVCGLFAQLFITYQDGSNQIFSTSRDWRCTTQEQSGWNKLSGPKAGWLVSTEIEPRGGRQWGRPGDGYAPPRSLQVRKGFTIERRFEQARLYIAGLGSYDAFINGERVGDVLAPGWTSYEKKVFYQTYDVTSFLKQGDNAIAIMLGNAWWSGGMGASPRRTYSEGPLRLMCQLVITFPDGRKHVIYSDETWKVKQSPILFNNIYDGEIYDARLETEGWADTQCDESGWEPVELCSHDGSIITAQIGPPIRKTQVIKPVAVTEPKPDVYVFDMGQNLAGWARLSVQGPAGQKVQLRFAEVLNADGTLYIDNYRGARATDVYILSGKGEEIWEPRFTYRGYRYVEVTGYPGKPDLEALTGCVVHSDVAQTGSFACSEQLLNKLYANIDWGLRGNLHSVPTDCPQRDERLGWMGDGQVIAPTACFNRDMADFFTKWQMDIIEDQDPNGAVHDVTPSFGFKGTASPAWGDAVIAVPWSLYLYYGDRRILETSYSGMAAWVELMKRESKEYLYEREGYGDWIAVVPSPKKPIGAAYFYYGASTMSRVARVLGKEQDAVLYAELAQKIAAAFQKAYYDQNSGWYTGATQTANLLPLAFGITPQEEVPAAVNALVEDITARNVHLSTGFVGTPFILPVLSKYGHHDLAFQLAVQKTYPSWGYMIEKGATTIWELWNSDTEGPGMNSRNHYALGAVGRWMYDRLLGLQPDEQQPGYKKTLIAPAPAGDLTWVEGEIKTLYGPLRCRWQKEKRTLRLTVSIPANTSAEIHMPCEGQTEPIIVVDGQHLVHKGKAAAAIEGLKFLRLEKEVVVVEAQAGQYEFLRVDE